ncbi:unnamed protein product [Protopolystoma xenopodis]|uniref:Uncharacterized protein n=1 Tax=Protopolystoma xenopodis TaxID=117903 RepID=A0A3S5FHD2_9PLAT|nr:unnamed protein product [Protopolystoma xenopodis]
MGAVVRSRLAHPAPSRFRLRHICSRSGPDQAMDQIAGGRDRKNKYRGNRRPGAWNACLSGRAYFLNRGRGLVDRLSCDKCFRQLSIRFFPRSTVRTCLRGFAIRRAPPLRQSCGVAVTMGANIRRNDFEGIR